MDQKKNDPRKHEVLRRKSVLIATSLAWKCQVQTCFRLIPLNPQGNRFIFKFIKTQFVTSPLNLIGSNSFKMMDKGTEILIAKL